MLVRSKWIEPFQVNNLDKRAFKMHDAQPGVDNDMLLSFCGLILKYFWWIVFECYQRTGSFQENKLHNRALKMLDKQEG
jgi:hypothetical protein